MSKNASFIEIQITIGNVVVYLSFSDSMLKQGHHCIIAPHSHSYFELRYITEGTGNYSTENNAITTQKGDIIIVPPHKAHHQSRKNVSSVLNQYCIGLRIKQPRENASSKQIKQYNDVFNFFYSVGTAVDSELKLLPYFEEISKELAQKKIGYAEKCQATATSFFIDLMRILHYEDKSNIFERIRNIDNSYWETEMEIFFNTQFRKDVTLQDFANALSLSRRQASRLMRQKYGVSFLENLSKTRIQDAKLMLEDTGKSIPEIWSLCGFKNYRSFLSYFHKYTGMSPSEYRAHIKKEDKS